MRSAHAGWGGVDDRGDPRLAIKKPGTTRQVVPGQQFSVAITVKKARHRLPAVFEVVLPDGALFVGPTAHRQRASKDFKGFKGRTPAPTSGSGWKAKRAAAKRFPLPDTVINGTAGERTLQWHLRTLPPRHNPIKLTFEVDFCGAPSPLALRLNWHQGGRSARPAVITVSLGVWGFGHPTPMGEREWQPRSHTRPIPYIHHSPYRPAQRVAVGQRPRCS